MSKKTANALIVIFLMFAMAFSLIAMPAVNAQSDLIMNLPGSEGVINDALIHAEVDIDLNGGPGGGENVSLWVKYPGRSDFTYIDTYLTRSNGDLDVYDFDFNETGVFECKWAYPPDSPYYPGESNVEGINIVLKLEVPAFAYINAVPNPVGINQEVLLHIGITQQLASAEQGWDDLTVTVTRPDNKTETLGPYRTDSTGGTGDVYIPTMEGTYTLQTHFPEQQTTPDKRATSFGGSGVSAPVGTWFLAADSPILELVVQAEPIEFYPAHPLPTEYWTRPIDAQLREWYPIAGSWLETPDEYVAEGNDDAPESPHILWAKPLTVGGLVGGEILQEHSFEMGDAYEGKWSSRFTMAGRVIYNTYPNSEPIREYTCIDIRTGEEIWTKQLLNNLSISFCQLMYWDTYDYHGVYDYIWCNGNSATRRLLGMDSSQGSPRCAFDANTGEFSWAFYDMPSGSRSTGPKGEMLYYRVNLNGGYMTLWNSSAVISLRASQSENSMGFGQWKAMGRIRNATDTAPVTHDTPLGLQGYSWNISIPSGLRGSVREVIWGDRVKGVYVGTDETYDWAFSLEPGSEGTLLYNNHATYTPPDVYPATTSGPVYIDGPEEEHVHLRWQDAGLKYWAYSLDTGALLWESEGELYLQHYVARNVVQYEGNLYVSGVAGIIYCYNFQTGLTWTYNVEDPYSEILWANDWWQNIQFIAGGKLYYGHEEHSPIDPRPRGAPYLCLNASTGELIWRANGLMRQTHWGGTSIIGDSVIVGMDSYDQRIYAIGKGPSSTTASIQNDVTTHGNHVLVTGTVTDVSPGTSDIKITMRFPNGVPAVSDANMTDWMCYVYKQFERPADVTGVEVVVSVLDPNNNCYEVGRTTSDASGGFKLAFEPEVPGEYTVIATFEGSRSYYGSFAETYLFVEEAPAATPVPTPMPESVADLYFLPMSIGTIIAIVIVLVLLVLMMFRKR
ncbi:MAG: hypothetical protein NWE84_00030 [Candidatus Bathyarchaeota archaeon]|nr:hypothetical protein [Candidatus Bathyarchaeota archaeon]